MEFIKTRTGDNLCYPSYDLWWHLHDKAIHIGIKPTVAEIFLTNFKTQLQPESGLLEVGAGG